ncbi:hypothetical protein, partial [Alkalihalobacillus trypoxylicola]|uniref:hypothetical protein n=1 Tax=Alkalihalobacillus trypoxylicola TaxID=519424 RepID=UPI000A87AD27
AKEGSFLSFQVNKFYLLNFSLNSRVDFVPHVTFETLYKLIDIKYPTLSIDKKEKIQEIIHDLNKSIHSHIQRFAYKLEQLVQSKI